MFPSIFVGHDLTRVPMTAVLFTAAIIVGCGDPGPTDIEQVMSTISDLSDAARDDEFFRSLFVDGTAPVDAERVLYSKYIFNMDEPTVTGETAKVNVKVTNAEGDVLGTKEWVFLFDAGQWKIQRAPLP